MAAAGTLAAAAPNIKDKQLTNVLTSAAKCLAVLDALSEHTRPVAVSELAARLGSPRGRVHQCLHTLVATGWVERLSRGQYRLTLRAATVYRAALEQGDIGERVRPHLELLASTLSEAVSLAVLDQGTALIVQRAEAGRVLRADVGVGTRMPLDGSASGRILVAYLSPDRRETLVNEGVRLPSGEALARAKEEGIVVSVNEFLDGGFAVAAPVFDANGQVLAALSSAGPTSRLDVTRTTEEVRSAAVRISQALNGSTLLDANGEQPNSA